VSATPRPDSSQDLEFRLHRIHQRRRRGLIRQVVSMAFWGIGLLAVFAFVMVLAIGAVSR